MDDLAKSLMFIARALVITIGGSIGLYKVVKGKSDEAPLVLREGFVTIGAVGVIFAATFAIQALFK